jgi:broad specificity phosphatase PhoE
VGVVYLLRHGQASLGTADYDRLSPLGRRQAVQVGHRLAEADLSLSQVVAGIMRRQRDTAAEAIGVLGRNAAGIGVDPRLDEYDHDGVLGAYTSDITFQSAGQGANAHLLQLTLDQAIRHWSSVDADGSSDNADQRGYSESHEAFVARIDAVLDDLADRAGTTLVATSGGVIAMMCARLLGLPVSRWVDLARVVVNAGLTKIVTGRPEVHLVAFNDHAHLETSRDLITYR